MTQSTTQMKMVHMWKFLLSLSQYPLYNAAPCPHEILRRKNILSLIFLMKIVRGQEITCPVGTYSRELSLDQNLQVHSFQRGGEKIVHLSLLLISQPHSCNKCPSFLIYKTYFKYLSSEWPKFPFHKSRMSLYHFIQLSKCASTEFFTSFITKSPIFVPLTKIL